MLSDHLVVDTRDLTLDQYSSVPQLYEQQVEPMAVPLHYGKL